MFELIRDLGQVFDRMQAWLLAQPLALRLLVVAGVLAALWVTWILLRVFLAALRAAFRGL